MKWILFLLITILTVVSGKTSPTDGDDIIEAQHRLHLHSETPDPSTIPPSTLTPTQKLECCICLYLPCMCALGCFSEVSNCVNTLTCGIFHRVLPCLNKRT